MFCIKDLIKSLRAPNLILKMALETGLEKNDQGRLIHVQTCPQYFMLHQNMFSIF